MKKLWIEEIKNKIGEQVELYGWVHSRRDHGKLIFLDIRDRSGLVQVVINPKNDELYKVADSLRNEWVVLVKGAVNERPEGMINEEIPTGKVEVVPSEIKVLSEAKTPPFEIDSDGHEIGEEHRIKYRYLDLRRERMKNMMILRHEMYKFIRNYLSDNGFIEIETPILTKSTPEGARDFLVPSRLQKGKFYALPQSPQQYKQLLMIAGFEKYFQMARSFRDEDIRADRAYGEFTQLDMEMSFVDQEDILKITEDMFTNMIATVFPKKKFSQTPWPRLTHKEAMDKYGTDKPDLRKNKEDKDELAFSWILDFPLFTEQKEDDYFHGSGGAKFAPSHHMFTSPHADDISLLDSDPSKVRGLQHDLVCNGLEVGGGSIRIHNQEIQKRIFDLIGFSDEQKKDFDHMLEAFSYGVPPHGGIAPGMDRLLMAIMGESSVRETMAFPADGGGNTSVMNAPSKVSKEQLDELGLKVESKDESR